MIPEKLRLPIIEFVSRAEGIPNLRVVVLFGSTVKGGLHKKSDIDMLLLFDCDHNPEVGKEAKKAHEIASDILSQYNIPHSFSFTMENINDLHLDPTFLRNVVNEGIIIWARPEIKILERPHPNMESMDIFSYTLTTLSPKEKMAVHRALYGYRVEKVVKGKKYINEAKGIVGEHGEKLGNSVFMLPSHRSQEVIEIFEKHGVNYKMTGVWV